MFQVKRVGHIAFVIDISGVEPLRGIGGSAAPFSSDISYDLAIALQGRTSNGQPYRLYRILTAVVQRWLCTVPLTMQTPHASKNAAMAGKKEPETDRSLRGQALRRATVNTPPRTLTAWEWKEWYAQHGVPDTHRAALPGNAQQGKLRDLLKKLLTRFGTAGRSGD